jgi:hypothetical protein
MQTERPESLLLNAIPLKREAKPQCDGGELTS